MLEMEKDLTPEIVAEIMEVSPRKVVELCADGKLGCYKVGKKYRITRQDLDKYRKANRVTLCVDSQSLSKDTNQTTGISNTMTESAVEPFLLGTRLARRTQKQAKHLPPSSSNAHGQNQNNRMN